METKQETCIHCAGTGYKTCSVCNGSRKKRTFRTDTTTNSPFFDEKDSLLDRCLFCNGEGQQTCTWCLGKGYNERVVFESPSILMDKPLNPPIFTMPRVHQGNDHTDIPFQLKSKVPLEEHQPYNPSGIEIRVPSEVKQSPPPHRTEPRVYRIVRYYKIPDFIFTAVFILILLSSLVYGIESTIVAAEAFFLFGGWAGIRAASLFKKSDSVALEDFRFIMAIGVGLSAGFLAAYLLLTMREGQELIQWVTARTIRLVSSLFVSLIGLGVVEIIWRRLFP